MSEAGQDRTWTQATLKHVASDDAVTGTCRVCGKPIAQALFSAAREAYCCEGCVLAERKRRELATVVDESQFALEVFAAEESALREMVDLKSGSAVDPLITAVELPAAVPPSAHTD